MKMSIRKLVAGSLVCAIAASSTPLLNVIPVNVSKVQAASREALAPGESELYLQEEAYGSQKNLYSSLWIYKGLGTTLKISSTSNDIKNVTCTFESSDPSIFTIDKDGVITPKSLGDATLTIHAKSEYGKEQTIKQDITVVDHFVCGDMSYGLVSDDEFIFLEASYASKDINRIMLPSMISEDVIKVIGKESCAGYKNVKLIEVPDTVTTIEDRAFADNASLEFVMIPKSVTEIADTAFGDGKAEDDSKKIIIKGYKGTEAEKYAKAHEDIVTFEAIDGEYKHYKYVYDMEFDGFDHYKTMEVDEEYQFSLKTNPEVVDEDIIFTSADESIVSVTSCGAAVAKAPGTTQIIATTTTGLQKKTTVVVSAVQPTEEPTPTPSKTPWEDHHARFINGTDEWSSGWYIYGETTKVKMPEVKEREGYRFLGWENSKGTYQPDEWVEIHDLSDAVFVAKWENIETTSTPAIGSAVTTSAPTSTPHIIADYPAKFENGEDSWSYGWYAAGRTSHVDMPEVEAKEGYRFLGWENSKGCYQPGETVEIHDLSDAVFVAKWEKVETTSTPATSSAVTTSAPTSTPVETTTAPTQTPEVVTSPYVTATPTTEPMPTPFAEAFILFSDGDASQMKICLPEDDGYATVEMITPSAKEGYRFLGWKNTHGVYQPGEKVRICNPLDAVFEAQWIKEQSTSETSNTTKDKKVKKASLQIVTKKSKKFAVGKKYTIKAKKANTDKALRWSVSNKKIAVINAKTGVLKAKKAGKVTITATCGKLKEKITIKIK